MEGLNGWSTCRRNFYYCSIYVKRQQRERRNGERELPLTDISTLWLESGTGGGRGVRRVER